MSYKNYDSSLLKRMGSGMSEELGAIITDGVKKKKETSISMLAAAWDRSRILSEKVLERGGEVAPGFWREVEEDRLAYLGALKKQEGKLDS